MHVCAGEEGDHQDDYFFAPLYRFTGTGRTTVLYLDSPQKSKKYILKHKGFVGKSKSSSGNMLVCVRESLKIVFNKNL